MGRGHRRLANEWPFPRYKKYEAHLRKSASEWFMKKEFRVHSKMPYCLDNWDAWPQNVILSEVAEYVKQCKTECEKNRKPFPLHKYIHHGLSSQALAFNLFGPLIVRKDYKPIINLLEDKKVKVAPEISNAFFEYEDPEILNENTIQPTSIDIVFSDSENRPLIFMESKLAEREFGACSVFKDGDCDGRNPLLNKNACYLHFIKRRYWELMDQYGFKKVLGSEAQCIFASHYQFFRELLFSLKHEGIFVLLSDQRSPVFHSTVGNEHRGLMPFLLGLVPTEYKDRVVSISIQEMVNAIKSSSLHKDWIG